jgi:hypothetical protein
MDTRQIELGRFEQVLEIVRDRFPHLRMEVRDEGEHVDAAASLPFQPGLKFEVSINLQNQDELHLNAGEVLWVSWFPCGNQAVFEGFVAAVVGVLSGEYRIVEFFVLGQPLGAKLEQPIESGWKAVTGCSNLFSFVPWPRSRHILQNRIDQ